MNRKLRGGRRWEVYMTFWLRHADLAGRDY